VGTQGRGQKGHRLGGWTHLMGQVGSASPLSFILAIQPRWYLLECLPAVALSSTPVGSSQLLSRLNAPRLTVCLVR
jgi:hypothetical protein